MGKGSNALTHKQVYMLCRWVEQNENRIKKISTKGITRLASKELNFFVTDNNILRAMEIVGNAPPTIPSTDNSSCGTGEESFVLDFENGDSCTVERIKDGCIQTTVFFPEGVVANSYPDFFIITLPKKDRVIKIKTYDQDTDLFEEISVSRDQMLVFRSITETAVERLL